MVIGGNMKNFKLKSMLILLALVFSTVMFASCFDTDTEQANLNLAELKANDVVLTLSDGTYSHEVDYEVDKLTLSATAEAENASVEGVGEKALEVGSNSFVVTVKVAEESKNYTVIVTRKSPDLGLKEVKIGDNVLTAGNDGVYVYNVENSVDSIELIATAVKSYATVEGAGEKTLAVGENTFTLSVKAGGQSENYTVKVIRAAAELGLSEVKIGDEVLTALSDGTYKYTVANTVTEITRTAVAVNANATVAGAGVKQNLVVGENRFEITVSAGEENKTYTVIVVREKSSVNTIAEVKVNGNVVNYDDDENAYLVTVNDKNASIVVTLTSEVSSYVIAPATGTLTEGENEFTITVTAENGATAAYTLIIELVLPTYNVTYSGNIEGAVVSEGFTYKHGSAQTLNITLAEKYTQSYDKITVTYKVGDGEEKNATLDGNFGFTVPAEEATGNITVIVKGIEINVYTITYHKDGQTVTEKVEYGANATKCEITPNTETKEVLDGYTYSPYERWVTEENGIGVASFENVTKDMDVYYKDDVLVRGEVAYYAPMGGAITYYTIQQMNRYVAGNENGDVEFKVLIKSLATDGQQEEAGKTSFVIYGTATWSAVNELGVSVLEQYLNKWFTVKATAADKKVTVYNPDGTVAAEKVFEAYAANTISLAMHADIAVAAVNPAIPEICTVTYLDENGDEIHSEKVFKGGAASEYDYSKPDEDLGNGYTKNYKNIRWLDSSYNIADLNNVNADISVKLAYDVYVIKNSVVATSDKKLTEINKFVSVGKDGKITFSVRINETGWAGFNIVAAGGYLGISGGVSASSVWYVVSIDTATGEITVATEDGAIKGLDKGNYNPVATTVSDIYLKLTDGNLDLAALNPDIVNMEFYDTDKTTLLKTEWVIRGSVNYVHTFETDSEGYTRMVDTWAYVEGSENKVYAAKAVYVRNQTTTGSDVSLLATNKYARVDSEGKITFKIRIAQTGWTGLNIILGNGSYVGVSGGLSSNGTEWLTVTIDTSNGDVVILNASGNSLTLDTGAHKDEATTIDNIAVNVSGAAFDISVVA